MKVHGSLEGTDLSHLVELAQGRPEPSALILETPGGTWTLFVAEGRVVHAVGPDGSEGLAALTGALRAHHGSFRLEPRRTAPRVSIRKPWNVVLLEALRRLDEAADPAPPTTPSLSQEEPTMTKPKKTRERIAEVLANLLDESVDIIGAAVVGIDGLVYSANFPRRGADENMIAASAAAVYGLSKRTMQQLHEGSFLQTLIQGSDGYLLVRSITPRVLFVGVLPAEVNLGMAFAETRTAASELAEILQGLF